MKRAVLAVLLLATVVILAYGYIATRREQRFRQLVVRGDSALIRGDTFSAVSAFGDAIAVKPESMVGYLKRGEAHRRRGELDAAAQDITRAAALDPTATRAIELLGDVEMARQQYDRAADEYAAYIRLDDRSPRVLYKLGLAHYLAGRIQAAEQALRTAIGLDGRFAEAHYLVGVSLREMNRPHDARHALERAVALAPGLLPAREQLADLAGVTGRRAERAEQLAALLARDPRPSRHVALAFAYAHAGQTSQAVRVLENAAALSPEYAGTHLALGRIWLEASHAGADRAALRRAFDALQHALALERSGAALALLGQARLLNGEPGAAERLLDEAADTLPVDPVTFLHLADAAERSGHVQAARRALLDYQSLAPLADGRGPDVARRIGDLSIRLRR